MVQNKLKILKQQIEKEEQKLKETLAPLIKKRKSLEVNLKSGYKMLAPLEDELSQLDAEIEHLMRDSEVEEINQDGIKFVINEEIAPVPVDMKAVFDWAFTGDETIEIKNKNGETESFYKPGIFGSRLVLKSQIQKLLDAGVMPNGVHVNTYKKFKIKKGV